MLKMELVTHLDGKVWSSITAVHLAATYLDPTLKEFLFVPSANDRSLFTEQAKNCIMAYGEDEYAKRGNLYKSPPVAATARSETENRSTVPTTSGAVIPEQEEEDGEPGKGTSQPTSKRQKLDMTDPLAAFRTGITSASRRSDGAGAGSAGFNYNTLDDYKAALSHDLAKYIGMRGPFEIVSNCQPQPSTSAARIQDCDNVFDPLSWWSKSSCKLPLLCKLAKQILVIPASSAESERHFSTAGKIARKDRAHLSSSAVEASVLVAQALKKRLL